MNIERYKMKYLGIIILLLTPLASFAEIDKQQNILKAWVYNIYNSSITRNKFSSFFEFNNTNLYSEIIITPSTNVDALYKDCLSNKFDLIFAPENIAKRVKEKCAYETALYSIEQPIIYAKKKHPKLTLHDFKTIGVLLNSPASQFIFEKTPDLQVNWKVKEFDDGAELIFALFRDEVDGIVTIESHMLAVILASMMNIEQVHSFNFSKESHILMPKNLNNKKRDFIVNSILENPTEFLIRQFKKY